ncbi:MAG: HIT domain-containing protein [Candidatus Micrarchaeaceae archaeon]
MRDPFCNKEDIAGTIFYKSRHFMALYNIRPILPGHSLLIPIRHVTRITELDEEESKDMVRSMKEVLPVLVKFYGDKDGSYNLAVQSGPSSGRTIDHLHIHLIPRKPDDRYHNSGFKVDILENLEGLDLLHVRQEVKRLREHFGFVYQA